MAYVALFTAIALELCGTLALKLSVGFTKPIPTALCLIFYALCFFIFSKAAVDLNLGVAYATWSGVGIIGSTLMSIYIFGESLNLYGMAGIGLIITGCLLLNLLGTHS